MVAERIAEAVFRIQQASDELLAAMEEFEIGEVDSLTSADVAIVYSRLQDLASTLEEL